MAALPEALVPRRAASRWWPLISAVLVAILISIFWYSPVLLPLKLLVVLFHEFSHAIAGVLTGGTVVAINLEANQGGYTLVRGGNRLLTLLAGYPGSMLWGCGILLASRWKRCAIPLAMLGVLLLASLYFAWNPARPFAMAYVAVMGGLLLLAARIAPAALQRLVLQVIAIVTLFYAIPDVINDVFRSGGPSDATLLQEHTGIPAVFWGALWITISGAVAWVTLRRFLRAPGP